MREEKDATVIRWALENLGVRDVFRDLHPATRAYTHLPRGRKALTDRRRRLDYILSTREVAEHPATQAAILRELPDALDENHLAAMLDIPLDCAGIAEQAIAVWDPHKVSKLKMKLPGALKEDEVATYRMRATESMRTAGQDHRGDLE